MYTIVTRPGDSTWSNRAASAHRPSDQATIDCFRLQANRSRKNETKRATRQTSPPAAKDADTASSTCSSDGLWGNPYRTAL